MGPDSNMTGDLVRGDTQREEGHWKTEAETGAVQLQTEHSGLLAATGSSEEAKKAFSLHALGGRPAMLAP